MEEDEPTGVRLAHEEGARDRGRDDSRVNGDIDSLYNDLHDEIIDALLTFDVPAVVAVETVALDALLFTFKLLYARESERGRERRDRKKKERERDTCVNGVFT